MRFKRVRLGELLSEGTRNGLNRPKRVRGNGLPMVNMGELFAHSRIRNVEMDLVPVSDREMHYVLQSGDLLFARQSLVFEGAGKCSIFLENRKPTVFESHLIRCRFDHMLCDPQYYYYFFQSIYGKNEMRSIVEQGASVAGIRGSDLVNLRVPHPPKDIQTQTASLLSMLDDRIDLLSQVNLKLESIAQAIFKSWFIDFDPVHAKAAGREPMGMDAETAALFPSEVEDSEMGPIPKGWKVSPFSDTVDVFGGGTPRTSIEDYWNGDIPWYAAGDAPADGQVFVIDTERRITQLGLGNSSTRILPPWTTIVSARGSVGKLALTGVEMAMNQTCYALRSKFEHGDIFTYLATQQLVQDMRRLAHGAIFDTITRSTLRSLSVTLPDEPTLNAFDHITRPLFERILNNVHSVETLAALRDTLLPRLISGRLRIPEAEEIVEEAVS